MRNLEIEHRLPVWNAVILTIKPITLPFLFPSNLQKLEQKFVTLAPCDEGYVSSFFKLYPVSQVKCIKALSQRLDSSLCNPGIVAVHVHCEVFLPLRLLGTYCSGVLSLAYLSYSPQSLSFPHPIHISRGVIVTWPRVIVSRRFAGG